MRNIVARLFVQHRVFLIACAAVLGGFQFILCAIVAGLDLESALAQILMFAPPALRAMIEQTMLGGSSAGVLAFGWNHPITHALATALPVTLAARAVAGEVENGAIELVLAQPLSRAAYLGAHVGFALAAMAALSVAGALGTIAGQLAFSLRLFGAGQLSQLVLGIALLQCALYGATLAASAFGREGGRVALAGVLLAVISYLVNTIASLWSKAQFLAPYSLHSYYDPRAILVQNGLRPTHVIVLTAVSLLCMAVAFGRLRTRDLP